MPRKPGDPNHPRKGKGAGVAWGGPAKGEGSREPGPGRGITGKSVAELMAQAGARELAAERWVAILNDPAHPRHADMVAKAADRLDGASKQTVEMRTVNPDDLTDDELAAIATGRGGAAAREAQD